MAKTRSFSIYLLKDGRHADNCFKSERSYAREDQPSGLPEGASLFVIENPPKEPWWIEYFSLSEALTQAQHGALFLLPVDSRVFCLCFGLVSHFLDEEAFEHDFGLKVTLNCIDPYKLKSTDKVDPGPARRQRTQLPNETELNFFDFDYESDILKSLTGKVKDEYRHLFRHATGSSNLRVGSKASIAEMVSLCKELLKLYRKEDYKAAFPHIQDVTPVKDPTKLDELNASLLDQMRTKNTIVNLMVPDIINYQSNVFIAFSGLGDSEPHNDPFIGLYYKYLEAKGYDFDALDVVALKKHQMMVVDENGIPTQKFSIYRCLIFDLKLGDETFHLRERQWYKVEESYLKDLKEFLDPFHVSSSLPPYDDANEGAYNERVASGDENLICMDAKTISPIANNRVEPCDLYTTDNDYRVFYHIKISTLSSELSHLFNQGSNSIALLKSEASSRKKLQSLLDEDQSKYTSVKSMQPDDMDKIQVRYAIVSRKCPNHASDNLPLFSRISLRRAIKSLLTMSVKPSFMFVEDQS